MRFRAERVLTFNLSISSYEDDVQVRSQQCENSLVSLDGLEESRQPDQIHAVPVCYALEPISKVWAITSPCLLQLSGLHTLSISTRFTDGSRATSPPGAVSTLTAEYPKGERGGISSEGKCGHEKISSWTNALSPASPWQIFRLRPDLRRFIVRPCWATRASLPGIN